MLETFVLSCMCKDKCYKNDTDGKNEKLPNKPFKTAHCAKHIYVFMGSLNKKFNVMQCIYIYFFFVSCTSEVIVIFCFLSGWWGELMVLFFEY